MCCALGASLVTASAIYGAQSTSYRYKTRHNRAEAIANAKLPHDTVQLNAAGGEARKGSDMSEELIQEQLSRNYLFFGEEGMRRIRGSFVVVVGVGGVGSWATTMLVRSGVAKVRIIDFDQVTLSSLNRHAVATHQDVGSPKVLALKAYLAKVAPWVQIEARNELFRKEDANELLETWEGSNHKPDFVIDAIDNIETKADLLAYCHRHKLPVIASMGAGCKSDPSRIFISDISNTNEDALSRATRRHLRLRGIKEGIPTVYSIEKPGQGKAQLKPLDEAIYSSGNVEEYGILPDFRARILPVLGTMPAIFGLTLVTHVLTTLAGYPTEPISGKGRKSMYESALKDLAKQNEAEGQGAKIPLTVDDIAFLIEELASGKSILPPHFPQKLTLVKHDPERCLSIDNVLVLTKDEAKAHIVNILQNKESLEEFYGEEQRRGIVEFLARGAALQKIRTA